MATLASAHHISLHTPIGYLRISGDEAGVQEVSFCEEDPGQGDGVAPAALVDCRAQLEEYFAGRLRVFELTLRPRGTDFQQQVWDELVQIPFGRRVSYKDVALRRWNDRTIRAVGTANGQNPIAIIVPCHRVVGSNGDLTGYAGGLWRKKWLLAHEEGIAHGLQASLF